jgi:uncharacterized protein (DUF1800 family)
MRALMVISLLHLVNSLLTGQAYNDYIGAGHNRGIIVTTSSQELREDWSEIGSGDKTLNGDGLEGKRGEAARLLAQATFGYTDADISYVVENGIEAWIGQQTSSALNSTHYYDRALYYMNFLNAHYLSIGKDPSELATEPNWLHWRYAFWDKVVYGEDQLRNRMAFALSQILVVSEEAISSSDALAGYYDLLSTHAFGNYRDLLRGVTMNATMGFYLSHLNNPRENIEENLHPDQNYAREIMQLFTIGLYQLNSDGSQVLDGQGAPIPTYDNEDIAELAKVFTGLGIGQVQQGMGDLYFGRGIYGSVMRAPMIMYEEWHEPGQKIILGQNTIPAGQMGVKDIDDAIDILFNHPSCPPFISKQLIQRFVTSNPSPQYVQRVTQVFINDGNGVRGNLNAVIKAILLDEEARSCESSRAPYNGKLSEPMMRTAQLLRNIGVKKEGKELVHLGEYAGQGTLQAPLAAPSVFNFFRPDHTPTGELDESNLVAPEFQILNSLTVINYPNIIYGAIYYNYITDNWEDGPFDTYNNIARLFPSSYDDEVLINKLDMIYTRGSMSEDTRRIIKEAIKDFPPTLDGHNEKIKLAIYLTLISADYIIQK